MVGGSTQGIGKAIAVHLALLGVNVILLARNMQSLKQVKNELDTSAGQEHQLLCVDFLDTDRFERVVREYIKTSGTIHILVNNTGGPAPGPIHSANTEQFREAFYQHLICNHILVQNLLPGMESEGYGRIINIISTSVKQPLPNLGVSNTVRGAVANWSKTLAGEVASKGITVNNVLPGATYTRRLEAIISKRAEREGKSEQLVKEEMEREIPAGRFGRPEEIAKAVGFLAGPDASYINGINLPVDGGRTACL